MQSKIITQEQINSIINTFFEINAPVKVYASLKEMFEKLPEVKEEKEKK